MALKRLDDILNPLGITKGSFRQMGQNGMKIPSWKTFQKNTRGRGAEYLYEEIEVVEAIRVYRSRHLRAVADKEEDQVTMTEAILNLFGVQKMKRSAARDTLGITKGAKLQEFERAFNDLVNKGVLHQPNKFSEPGVYAVKDAASETPVPPPEVGSADASSTEK